MNLINTIKNFYRRPMRKGAMLDRSEAKTIYFSAFLSIGLFLIFSISAYFMGQSEPFTTLVIATWSFSVFILFGLTVQGAMLYGYHCRDQIDPENEVPIDLSKAYLGGLLAAIFAPIVHAIINYFGG